MDALSLRRLLVVALLQAAVCLAALFASRTAALAAGVVGVLALGRYAAIACFASMMGHSSRAGLRALAASAWIFGLAALVAAMAAVALRSKPSLPWAVAASFVGPLGMSALALGSGIVALSSGRADGLGAKR
jgi:hypothetical protein